MSSRCVGASVGSRYPSTLAVVDWTWWIIPVFVFTWAGVTLLLDSRRRGRAPRRTLADRLAPYQPQPVADDAERWLRERQ